MAPDKRTLLLVEDDPILAATELYWLKKAGYETIHVSTGEKAIETVNEKTGEIDLILMDINLGKGIDGTQAAQIILKDNDIPLLFLSSHTEKEVVAKTEQITSYGYVVKDSKDVVLLASIKMAFKLHNANKELRIKDEAIRQSEKQFRAIVDSAPFGAHSYSLESDGKLIFCGYNNVANKILKIDHQSLIGKTIEEAFPDLVNTEIPLHYRKVALNGNLYEDEQVSYKDGKIEDSFEIHAFQTAQNKVTVFFRDVTEQKKSEHILIENEEKFRTLLEFAPDAFFQGDGKGNFITVNNKAVDLTGYPKEELLTMNMADLFPKEILEIKPLRYDLLKVGNIIKTEREIQNKNGERIFVEMNSRAMPDGTYQSFIRDITEKKKAEEKLIENENRYRTLFDLSPSGITLLDLNGNIIEINNAACISNGYSKEEIIGKNIRLVVKEENISLVDQHLSQLLNGETLEHEVLNITKSGECRTIELRESIINLPNGNKGILSISNDISARKAAEEALKENEKNLLTMINAMPDIVCFKDGKGRWLMANEFDLNLFQLNDIDYKGKTDSELAHFSPFYKDAFLACEASDEIAWNYGKASRCDEIIPKPDGTQMVFDIIKIPTFNDAGERKGLIVVGRDITERRRTMTELESSEKKYKDLFEKSEDAILIIENNKFVDCNLATVRMLGYTNKEELLITHPSQLSPEFQPDGKSSFEKANEMMDIALRKGSHRFEWNHMKANGIVFPVEVLLTAINTSNDKVILHTVWRDITERKQAEEELKEREIKFRVVFENSVDAIGVSQNGRHVFINPAYINLFGYSSQEELLNVSIINLIAPSQRERIQNYINSRSSNDNSAPNFYETKGIKKDGTEFEMEVHVTTYSLSNQLYTLVILRNISDQKNVLFKLAESERNYRMLIENQTDLVVKVDLEGKFIFVSPSYCRTFGKTEQDLIGNTFMPLVHIDDRETTANAMKQLYKPPYTAYMEQRAMTKDGWRWFSWVDTAILNNQGEVESIIGIGRDITDTKNTEEALHEIEMMFNSFIKYNPIYVYIKDKDIRPIYVSDNFKNMLGIPASDIIGKTMDELFPSDFSKKMIEDDKRILNEGKAYEFQEELNGRFYTSIKFPIIINGVAKYLAGYTIDITDKKINEMAVEESEKRYRNLVDISPDAIAIHCEGKFVYVNNAAIKLIKAKDESELIGLPISDILHPDYKAAVIQRVKAALKDNLILEMNEEKFVCMDGSVIDVEVTAIPTLFKGKPAMQVVARDITKRKEIEEMIKSSELFHRQVIENAGSVPFQLIFGDTYASGYYQYMGKGIEKLVGLKPNEVNEKNFSDMIITTIPLSNDMPEDPFECHDKMIEGNLKRYSADILVKSKTGELKWLHDSSLPIWDEQHTKIIGAMGILTDISERKFAEETLRKSEEKFRNLIERMPDAVYKSTHEGKFLEVNPAMVKMLGYDSEEDLKSIDIKKDLYFDIADRESAALIEKYEEMAIFPLKKKDGTGIWVEDHGRHILDENGNVLYHEGIMRDVTQRTITEIEIKKYSDQLKESNAAKDKLFSIISHDLKNPFHSINSAIRLMIDEGDEISLEDRNRFLKNILSTSEKSYNLLENLLLWSRHQMDKVEFLPERISISEVVIHSVELLKEIATFKNISICLELDENAYIMADRTMLETVIRNLITNAIKFTKDNGKISVVSNIVKDKLELSIIDSGVGILSEDIPRLFQIDKTFTTLGTKNETGTGLGLIICKDFVEKNNGQIWVESEINKGSKFVISFNRV